MSGLGDMLDKAKGLATPENIEKVKSLATDENVDTVADKIKEFAPDRVDGLVDKAADQAKRLND
ncbi:hypothetical protein [Isoptericola variabilis]|uniref:Antitoxin n=1 Tax=Isoptericola variabilis (strain 225) TaxID=743718 RepID=F6FVJ1_ISOV2|nr:hypothetical protein [Isoptericola variabilis]AEG44418.1 hypothetical protein Isova_1666 [Isoptericola variabilis 225]TWH34411.1 hypothetical protein L600_001200000670 [Isoptericola variabilis J7]